VVAVDDDLAVGVDRRARGVVPEAAEVGHGGGGRGDRAGIGDGDPERQDDQDGAAPERTG
jgi:hypothetical protein